MSWFSKLFGGNAGDEGMKTGGGKRYYNSQWDFSIVYPRDWEILTENRPAGSWVVGVAVASKTVGGYRCGLHVNACRREVLEGNTMVTVTRIGGDGTVKQAPKTPAEFLEKTKVELKPAFRGLRFLTSEETTLAGNPAARLVYGYDSDGCRTQESSLTVFCKGLTFQIICEVAEHQVGTFKPTLDEIISSFTLGKV